MERNSKDRHELVNSPRADEYDYCDFPAVDNPEGVLIAQQIQAQSYVNMKIVRPEGIITLPSGEKIIDPMVSNPTGEIDEEVEKEYIEYSIGVEKNTHDLDATTGKLVAWRKVYAALDALPAYKFCQDGLWLWQEGEHYLRYVAADTSLVLAEPEALGKTIHAEKGVIKEFIRNEIQRSLGKGEVWFMGLVEKTVYHSWVYNWGPTAVMQVGLAKRLENPNNFDDVALVPTVMEIDNFYINMMQDIKNLGDEQSKRRLVNFIYMSDGLSDEVLGPDVAAFRRLALDIVAQWGETHE
jgi:hypothetical protein